MLKPRFTLGGCRTYATRRPEKPPARFPDPLRNNPRAVVTPLEGGKLSFIHRPPPSAPSPHSTTLDPASPLLRPATAMGSGAPSPLPPLLRPSAYKPAPPRLSTEDIEKLRTLRRTNPRVYSCTKLASMFDCTPGFVSQVAALPRALRRAFATRQAAKVEVVKAGWGERKATVRAIKERRRAFW
ncbi:mitochondrial ribosomal protein subunit L20-domain-containing protein [Boletus coccyginus]|nr:mitochondrial ribosomal protein subunit L20-domain-containing protein [Boletus coccyginus]